MSAPAAVRARPGAVVACWEGGGLAFAVVAGEEKQRIRIVLPGGREERVRSVRIVLEVAGPGPVPGTGLEERREAGARAAAIEERVKQQALEVQVPLIWEIVTDAADPGSAPRPMELAELTELALESTMGDAQAALLLALIDEGIRFLRRGELWIARPAEAVEELELQRRRVAQKQVERCEFLAALEPGVCGESYDALNSDFARRSLEALERLAIHEESAATSDRGLAQAALEASGLRFDRPHEGAFKLLRKLGRFSSDDENLQLRRYGLRVGFDEELLCAATAAVERGFDGDGRSDLSGLETVSIDGSRTLEIDDLLSLDVESSGVVRLGVHIADPGAFLEPGDPLDREALARATTHYMPDRKLLMLPSSISELAASLIKGQRRPALSFFIRVDADGQVVQQELQRSIVCSSARLDYEAADLAIEERTGPHAQLLGGLARLGTLRETARLAAGAVLLKTDDVEFVVGPDGTPRLERLPADSPSRRAVSEAMILAGAIAAGFCGENKIPLIYRRQSPARDLPRLADGPIHDPLDVRAVRRCLKRASLGMKPGRHSSLGLQVYTQISSPLRRYQDLAGQRQIQAVLRGDRPPYDTEVLQRIAATTEQVEFDARRAERAASRYWRLRYLESRTGSTVEALVLDTHPRPIVQLTETLWEGAMPSLSGVEPGERLELRIERVNPRADLLVLGRAR